MPAPYPNFLSRRLLMFTGKGGVGKSTLVAGLALEAARRGQRPLVVELGHRASMEGIFGCGRIGYEPREVGRGVQAMNLEFQRALEDYMAEHVRVKRVASAIMSNKTLQKFFHAAPSVSEVATLNKLGSLEAQLEAGRPKWDPILVDLDATGHALMLLDLPRVMDGLVGDGPMRRLIDGFSSLLCDPQRTVLNLVTLPRELPALETIELYRKLRERAVVELGALFVNGVPAPPFSDAQADLLERTEASSDEALSEAIAVGRRAQRTARDAASQVRRLRDDVDLPLVELPRLRVGTVDLDAITQMGAAALGELETERAREQSA